MESGKASVIRKALKIKEETTLETDVKLIVEEPLEIRIESVPYAVLMRTPGDEIELAAGFCLTEGIVDSFREIASIDFCADETEDIRDNIITVKLAPDVLAAGSKGRRPEARSIQSRSSCGLCGVRMIEDLRLALIPAPENTVFSAEAIVRLQHRMSERQELSRHTTAAHAAALADAEGRILTVKEDVGRHNAMDKAIGYGMQNGVDFNRCMMLLSGRISFEMVQKALRAGIPLVTAVSAATSLSVKLADQYGCTLVGRLRDERMTVYTHPERIRTK